MKTDIIFYEFLEHIEEHDGLRKSLKNTLETDGLEVLCVVPSTQAMNTDVDDVIFVKEERCDFITELLQQEQVHERSLEETTNKVLGAAYDNFLSSSGLEDDDDLPEAGIEAPRLYGDDPAFPVFRWGLTKGVSTDEIAGILLRGNVDQAKVATKVPTNVSKNTSFIVDTTKLRNDQDVKCDDLGAWHYTGTKKFGYSLDDAGVIYREDDFADEPQYQLSRQFFKNKSLPSLRKIVVMARNMVSSLPEDLCFVQYIFEDGEQEVDIKAHGNCKNNNFGKP
ncbi:Hypothetical predicted protein [Paramuricea clavata]|uniref:Uncharacterized protein n=1 Tax=Paramuricea clavata TaxID=317549 RepID=A0A7D9H7I6_PARCT|nr:Hypothetical predicted protein [Paramuricea clavata]